MDGVDITRERENMFDSYGEIEMGIEEIQDDEVYRLSFGAIMAVVLKDYGITPPTMKICEHMLNDLMDLMVKQGYAGRSDDE